MRICHDCLTVNRSHLSYCQKCSGELGLSEAPYLSIKISKKRPRRVPVKLWKWLDMNRRGAQHRAQMS